MGVEGALRTFPVHGEAADRRLACEEHWGLRQSSSLGMSPNQHFFGKKTAIPCENDPSLASNVLWECVLWRLLSQINKAVLVLNR